MIQRRPSGGFVIARCNSAGSLDGIPTSPSSLGSGADSSERPGLAALLAGEKAPILWMVFALSFSSCLLMSVSYPFLPGKLASMNQSTMLTGVAFAAYPLASMFSAPVVTICCGQFGRPAVIYAGLIIEGVFTILMGFFDRLFDDPGLCAYFLVVLRLLQGTGSCCNWTAFTAVACDVFPDDLGTVMGFQELFSGLGYMLGPPIGGMLYSLGGFELPFVGLGTSLLFMLVLLPFIFRKVTAPVVADAGTPSSRLGVISGFRRSPIFLAASLLAFLAAAAYGVLSPVLSTHLESRLCLYHKGALGAIFSINAVTYGLSAPLLGRLAEKSWGLEQTMVGGCLVLALSFLLVGPSPLLGLADSYCNDFAWIFLVTAQILFGLALSAVLIPVIPAMKMGLSKLTRGNAAAEAQASEVASAAFTVMYSAGEGLGPLLTGFLVGPAHGASIWSISHMTVGTSATFYASLCLLYPAGMLASYVHARICPRDSRSIEVSDRDLPALTTARPSSIMARPLVTTCDDQVGTALSIPLK